ncbi:MAG: glycoside hydrolase family 3 C-terminal domain-containing protein [Anaerolineae bacterium]|nr:glycoside hydrolase family 3 C-terminal domain-containing protein [Thermoflexales bacterium]MDW8406429.1 glycoside hydrolase family 3 C-terminal domain-containing protein [Anaerolineae bacterium]
MDEDTIIAQMTLDEKAALCTGESMWTTTPLERLGVPRLTMSDGPHGVRRVPDMHAITAESLPATCFPTASCLAATWNVDLIYAVGQALGREAAALGVDVLLGPGVNMKRTPLCGRNFEYYSEDPYLAGRMAVAFINGLQSIGVGASLKHFAANNQEYQRFSISAVVDERTLREIYLPAFEMAVQEARPWTVMCAYNKLNGIYCSEHHELLTDILKKEWGFEGVVVSDWGAVHDRVKALQAGLDLEMPGPQPQRTQAVVQAVRNGALDEAVLDEAVRRILKIVFKAAQVAKGGAFDQAAHHTLARSAAGEGIVLLKNTGVLPLRTVQRIAVIGRAAKEPHFQGGGSSHVHPTQVDIPFDALQQLAGQVLAGNTHLTYREGYPATPTFDQALIDEAVQAAKEADVALVFAALPGFKESEGYDRADLDLTPQQVALIKAVCAVQPQTVVILNNGSAVAMNELIDGAAAVLEAWMMGQAGGGAIADVVFGVVNPSGKLAETFPLKLSDTPAFLNFPGENGQVRYGEGLFIGYRYYDATDRAVLFPFGHGLSYTTFAYSNPRLSAGEISDRDSLTVSVDVTNTGQMAGKEVVQVYVHDRESSLKRPYKELKGFAKVALEPGETKTVSITLDFRAFAFYHPGYKQWIAEDGAFDILIGASATDIRCTQTVTLRATRELPCLLNRESTVREWLNDQHGRRVFEPIYQNMRAQLTSDQIGMDMMGFMMEMPLASVLYFQQKDLPKPAEELLEELLHQAHAASSSSGS